MDGDGLTATPEQIIDFLRKGEVSTWAASAKSVPDRPKSSKPDKPASTDEDVPSAIRPRTVRSGGRWHAAPSNTLDEAKPVAREDSGGDKPSRHARPAQKTKAPEPDPEQEAELVVRQARPQDAASLHHLLSPLGADVNAASLKRAISSAATRKEPFLMAEQGALVGCLAWHIIPDPLRGDTARITIIFVDEDARRRGVGRALYDAANAEMRRRKIVAIEAMSEIEVRNANGFYRAMGLKQASYRFVAEL
jgi:N-acetylglutamate synthase-like GNAT family acetyltransferase